MRYYYSRNPGKAFRLALAKSKDYEREEIHGVRVRYVNASRLVSIRRALVRARQVGANPNQRTQ